MDTRSYVAQPCSASVASKPQAPPAPGQRPQRHPGARIIWTAAAFLCLASTASAQQPTPPVSTIRVSANAVVPAKPDRVELDIGVVTQATQAREAADQNAGQATSVLAALRAVMGEHADIKTVSYSLTPIYRYQPTGGEPSITGYTATNVVRITLDDLDKMGPVIDTATRSGANRVQDIRLTLRDPQAVRLQALRQAANKAKAEAETLAATLGVKVLRVLSVDESGGRGAIPIRHIMLAAARAGATEATTPIESSTLDVGADVTLTVQVTEP